MAAQEESTEHFFTAFTDLLVGVIFLFMLLLMVFALNLKHSEKDKEAEPVIITEEVRATLLREIGTQMQAQQMPVTLDLANGIVRLPEALLFESGASQLSEQGERVVASLAEVLQKLLPCASKATTPCQWQQQPVFLDSVLIEGHTDKRPFTDEKGHGNWELSAFRAITVYKTMLAAQPTLDQAVRNPAGHPLLGVSAYADNRPVDREQLDPNRRIDIRFNMHAAQLGSAP